MITPEVVWLLDAALGEGPVWLPHEQRLLFVDIKRGRIHAYDPGTGEGLTMEVGGAPSFIYPTEDDKLLVGSLNSIHHLEDDQLGHVLVSIPEPAHNRTNDAAVDVAGRLWFGTMDDRELAPTGAIWCWDGRELTPAGPTAVVTNGPAIGCDDKWLYHVDSGNRTIWRHPLGPAAELAPGEVFVRIDEQDGFPDGIVVDSEDCLWVALWDGWCVRRYSPSGELMAQIEFPCARVTKLAFGGPDLTTAFVTTARVGIPDSELAGQLLAGSLFAFEAPAPGLACAKVRCL